jgi:hypothetical protein
VIAHLLLFRFRPELDDEARRALAECFAEAVNAIPTVRRARVGTRIRLHRPYESLMRADYPYAAIIEFDDREGLTAYLEHPAHRELASRFFQSFEDALIYDFDLTDGTAVLDVLPGDGGPSH